ncbi:hypothetical protein CC117_06475 [Parafrankia colletiae]|uniref:Uncharacterized protein n=1 Tax=Parafrankia colletiae TaxID=573497 RepID=A0A1S1Q6R0_9ACTN|nr:hypothetical protein CC117_06475 [Parafrankia colletiae]
MVIGHFGEGMWTPPATTRPRMPRPARTHDPEIEAGPALRRHASRRRPGRHLVPAPGKRRKAPLRPAAASTARSRI